MPDANVDVVVGNVVVIEVEVSSPIVIEVPALVGAQGPPGITPVAFRYIGNVAPATAGWVVNDFWFDTSTE